MKAMIIGCGSIGALKDDKYDSPDTENVLTWAHALYNNDSIKEIIFVDQDREKAKKASVKWGGSFYSDLKQGFCNNRPNIIIVAVNTSEHYNILDQILTLTKYLSSPLPLVIIEKPFTDNKILARNIVEQYNERRISLMVNYTRRFEPRTRLLRNRIKEGIYGKIYHAKLTYTRGLKREACHAIDLCNFFFGEYMGGRILNKEKNIDDFSKEDLTYAAYLSYEKCPHIFFCPVDGRKYSIFDLEILTEKGKITLTDHGKMIREIRPIEEPTYGNYMALPAEQSILWNGSIIYTKLTRALIYALDNAIYHIKYKQPLVCPATEAVKVHEVLSDLNNTYPVTKVTNMLFGYPLIEGDY